MVNYVETRKWRDAVENVLEWYIRSRVRDITDMCVISFLFSARSAEPLEPFTWHCNLITASDLDL